MWGPPFKEPTKWRGKCDPRVKKPKNKKQKPRDCPVKSDKTLEQKKAKSQSSLDTGSSLAKKGRFHGKAVREQGSRRFQTMAPQDPMLYFSRHPPPRLPQIHTAAFSGTEFLSTTPGVCGLSRPLAWMHGLSSSRKVAFSQPPSPTPAPSSPGLVNSAILRLSAQSTVSRSRGYTLQNGEDTCTCSRLFCRPSSGSSHTLLCCLISSPLLQQGRACAFLNTRLISMKLILRAMVCHESSRQGQERILGVFEEHYLTEMWGSTVST